MNPPPHLGWKNCNQGTESIRRVGVGVGAVSRTRSLMLAVNRSSSGSRVLGSNMTCLMPSSGTIGTSSVYDCHLLMFSGNLPVISPHCAHCSNEPLHQGVIALTLGKSVAVLQPLPQGWVHHYKGQLLYFVCQANNAVCSLIPQTQPRRNRLSGTLPTLLPQFPQLSWGVGSARCELSHHGVASSHSPLVPHPAAVRASPSGAQWVGLGDEEWLRSHPHLQPRTLEGVPLQPPGHCCSSSSWQTRVSSASSQDCTSLTRCFNVRLCLHGTRDTARNIQPTRLAGALTSSSNCSPTACSYTDRRTVHAFLPLHGGPTRENSGHRVPHAVWWP